MEGAELDEAIEQYTNLMIRLRPNFGVRSQGAAFQGMTMTMGLVFPLHKEALNAAIPSLPVRKRVVSANTTVRQMRTGTAVATDTDCPTCGKKIDQSVAGASVLQMTKIQTSGASSTSTAAVGTTLPAGPVASDGVDKINIGTTLVYDNTHGPEYTPADEAWAGLLTTLPTVDAALNFYYTMVGTPYPADAPRDHISILKAIHFQNAGDQA